MQITPLRNQCTKTNGNRSIPISFSLLAFRTRAREILTSEEGKLLRARRSVKMEIVFGQVKYNKGIHSFHFRGKDKVKTEWALVSIALNMKKLETIQVSNFFISVIFPFRKFLGLSGCSFQIAPGQGEGRQPMPISTCKSPNH